MIRVQQLMITSYAADVISHLEEGNKAVREHLKTDQLETVGNEA